VRVGSLAVPARMGHRVHQLSEDEAKPRTRRRWVMGVATGLWFGVFALGTAAFLRFEFIPGDESKAPIEWPRDSTLALRPDGMTLVLFAHPHCVCTRASLDELQVIMSHHSLPVSAQVVFVQLPGFTDNEMRDESWEKAGRIPGVDRYIDLNGVEAHRFTALVSGYTLLYDAAGGLLFEGGITGSRGQIGANAGRRSVIQWLSGGKPEVARTHVFGCSLFDRAMRMDAPAREVHGA